MTTGIIIFLGIVVGMLLFLGIVVSIIWIKLKITAKKYGYDNIRLNSLAKEIHEYRESSSHTPKSISGMTNLMLPIICEDFPDFDEELIYQMVEEGLRIIFNALSSKDKSMLDSIPLLQGSISQIIDDYENNNIDVNYSDIFFHKKAIEHYTKQGGVATIKISVAVEYYYKKQVKDKVVIDNKYKTQTRYTCTFIYIYDESVIDDEYWNKVVGLNCPNCGAPIRSLKQESCSYCGTAVLKVYKDINVKGWAFSSFKEY